MGRPPARKARSAGDFHMPVEDVQNASVLMPRLLPSVRKASSWFAKGGRQRRRAESMYLRHGVPGGSRARSFSYSSPPTHLPPYSMSNICSSHYDIITNAMSYRPSPRTDFNCFSTKSLSVPF
ncbi:hypothetical protein HPP92_029005 [Vanilla planifolia]|uniref:Uncharacterized protein n=1 Tax=Vanilla planifolia TaxID=51239 RepID=A0A835U4S3_VANPL|nr:hypothetical protein HPP92_029005 [Vanilla planifolia]KAG0446111.1 hypothetical protein HPP92_028993 [Vanilla planifolia]